MSRCDSLNNDITEEVVEGNPKRFPRLIRGSNKLDEVEVAFEAIHFHSAYGKIPVLADRSCQPQTAWALTVDTWKLRTLGKAPHILTYGMEGLTNLALLKSSLIDLEARQGDRAQAYQYAA